MITLSHQQMEAIDELIAAAGAIIDTFSDHCIARATRDGPAEYVSTHEQSTERELIKALADARAALVAAAQERAA